MWSVRLMRFRLLRRSPLPATLPQSVRALTRRQTAGYLAILRDEYLANYGYERFVGPAPSIIDHPLVRVRIRVWASHLEYLLHEYEAEELHHVVAGTPAFGTADGN